MLPSGTYNSRYEQCMAIFRTRAHWVMLLVLLIVLFTLPFYGSRYALSFLSTVGIVLIAVQGLNILTGYSGQISVGQAAFVGVGSYTCVLIIQRLHAPFLVALLCAGLLSGVIGVIFGYAGVRIKGFYLAMSTLAAQVILGWCFLHLRDLTGGTEGMRVNPATIGALTFDTAQKKYCLIMVFTLLTIYFAKNLMRTRTGRALIAIRDNDLAAGVLGINPVVGRIVAFFLCCFFAGVAGSLWAHYTEFINPIQFTLDDSILYIGMLIVGGMGSIMGPIFGVVAIRLLGEVAMVIAPALNEVFPMLGASIFSGLSITLYSIVIILFLIFEPRGINHRWIILKNQYRLYPFAY